MPRLEMENIQMIRKAVKLYENNRCLWDPNEKHYFNKISRERIWRKISAEFNIPAPDIKKKLTSLLGSYRREKSREKKSQLRKGTGKVYKSKWFAYPWFAFLSNKNITTTTPDTETLDTTESNADENNEESLNIESLKFAAETNSEDCNEDYLFENDTIKNEYWNSILHDEDANSSVTQKVIVATKNKVRKRHLNSKLISKEKVVNSAVDHFTSFGKYVADELRKYDDRLVPHVKKAILDIVFKADTGQFPVQHSYTYTSGYHTSSPSSDPIASPPHLEESSDSTLQQNFNSDNDDHVTD